VLKESPAPNGQKRGLKNGANSQNRGSYIHILLSSSMLVSATQLPQLPQLGGEGVTPALSRPAAV
jgi:hypothetical protein